MFIKVLLVVVYIAVMLAIGIINRHKANTVENFVLGGRAINPWMAAFSYGTAYFSGVIFVGNGGQFGWRFGTASIWIGLFGCVILATLLPWVILGRRTQAFSRKLKSTTMADYFGFRFNSKGLRLAVALIIFVFLIPYTSSIYNGLSTLFEICYGIPFYWCIIGVALLTGVYVVLGGYMASSKTDFIQGCVMVAGILALIFTLFGKNGGFKAVTTALANVPGEVPGQYASMFGTDFTTIMLMSVMVGLGGWCMPQTIHKYYVVKNEQSFKIGTIVSTLFALVVGAGCYIIGGFFDRLYDMPEFYANGAIKYDYIIPNIINTLGDFMVGFVMILVLAASMSTLASLVISSSSTVTLDLVGQLDKNMDEKKKMLWIRALSVVFVVLSAALSVKRPMFISQLLSLAWGVIGGAFIGPFTWSLYFKKTSKAACWVCFIFGVGFVVLNNLVFNWMPSTNASGFVMIMSLIIAPIVSLIVPAKDTERVDELFTCIKE
ncbi:MAG: sodium:solute symporter [Lachnospiraceae bacterium]|nr:sodium:solute symporter [Lachnospiraceae bacterium]